MGAMRCLVVAPPVHAPWGSARAVTSHACRRSLLSAEAWPGTVAVALQQAFMRRPAELRREASPRLLVRVLEGVPCADARMQVLARDGG